MLEAISFLGKSPETVRTSPELRDQVVEIESVGGCVHGDVPASGLSFVVGDDGRIDAVHLHGTGHEGSVGYPGLMPGGMEMGMSRAEVRALLGSPRASAEPRFIEYYGEAAAWDLFDLGEAQMHVEYRENQRSVQLVTLMLNSVAAGLQ